ncbi:surface protease GP63 [Trypanosoma grayi]|uniref:surface protease GP63 n=1 Tax=Trypanosoma grayi TaxID=71804 RepID=UPI0004F482FD|nr:surface protease GP63 [Trypanosoma grayi]KEG07047.1 surface protease GP63 [Trypanosoma grayi]
MLNKNNHAQRVCRLLGVTLLLLVHCAGSTLAVTEHHRCMYDYVSRKMPDVEKLTNLSSVKQSDSTGGASTVFSEFVNMVGEHQSITLPLPVAGYKPLRIKVFAVKANYFQACKSASGEFTSPYGDKVSCTQDDVLTEEKKNILEKTIIPEAVKLHTERLYVKPTEYRVIAPNFKNTNPCSQLDIPEEHKTKGVDDVDMVLYATTSLIVADSFAWAATCAVQGDGRPVIGVINYSPRHIARTSQAVRVAAHEIAHTLGFNVKTMKKHVGKNVPSIVANPRGKDGYVFDAPNTRLVTEYFYNCSNYKIPLESEAPWMAEFEGRATTTSSAASPTSIQAAGAAPMQAVSAAVSPVILDFTGPEFVPRHIPTIDMLPPPLEPLKVSVSSHWKRRVAKDELMTGLVGAGRYTLLTLSAFSDLKFYMVNWTKAETMSWGKNAGCEFLTNEKKCVVGGKSQYPSMFCDESFGNKLKCTSDRQSLGTCIIKENENIPTEYSYFEKNEGGKKRGGRREDMMDYCPIIVADRGFSCINGNESNMPGSLIREDSRCVEGQGLMVEKKEIGDVCVQMKCTSRGVYFRVAGSNNWYGCPAGESRNVAELSTVLSGSIVCPNVSEVCPTKRPTLRRRSGRPGRHIPSGVLQKLANIFRGRKSTGSGLEDNKDVEGSPVISSSDASSGSVERVNEANTAPGVEDMSSTTMAKSRSKRDIAASTDEGVRSSEIQTPDAHPISTTADDARNHQIENASGGSQTGSHAAGSSMTEASHSPGQGTRQSIIKAHGKSLDVNLNADSSAAASALMPLVLAVVAASAIMAH